MLKIRLTRLGNKGNAFYRVIVAESRESRDGKFIELLGTYDPKQNDKDTVKINKDAALSWLAKGAQPTGTVKALLIKSGILQAEKFKPRPNAKTVVPKEKKA